jgi:drug/metabolite transporter (DMT)-like permease
MRGLARGSWIEASTASMLRSNGAAACVGEVAGAAAHDALIRVFARDKPLSSAAVWSRIPLGVRFMIGSALAFSGMSALVKHAGIRLSSQELVFARSLVAIVISIAMLRRAGVHTLGNRRWLLLARGVWGYAALSCGFFAVMRLPLAEATMIQYLHPVFTAMLAAVVLGERADRSLAASVLLGSAGVLLVTRPAFLFDAGGATLDPLGLAVALCGALLTAVAYVGVRELSSTEHPLVIVLWFPLVSLPASLPATIAQGVWPRGTEWLALLGVGVLAQIGQVCLTRGLALEPAGRAMAISYVQIAFATLWGVLFFGEVPGVATLLGSLLVLLGTAIGARAVFRSQ